MGRRARRGRATGTTDDTGGKYEQPIEIKMGCSFIAISSESTKLEITRKGYDDEEHRVLSTDR